MTYATPRRNCGTSCASECYSLTKLTQRLGKSRRWIYHAFENPILSIDVVLEISKIIHHDFSDEITELKRFNSGVKAQNGNSYIENESVDYWKNKYLVLLEKYNAMLEK